MMVFVKTPLESEARDWAKFLPALESLTIMKDSAPALDTREDESTQDAPRSGSLFHRDGLRTHGSSSVARTSEV